LKKTPIATEVSRPGDKESKFTYSLNVKLLVEENNAKDAYRKISQAMLLGGLGWEPRKTLTNDNNGKKYSIQDIEESICSDGKALVWPGVAELLERLGYEICSRKEVFTCERRES